MTSIIRYFAGRPLLLVAEGGELVKCKWCDSAIDALPSDVASSEENEVLVRAVCQLAEYFAGARKDFDVPFRMNGTDFQRRVWLELQKIPYGAKVTYKNLACRIGQPAACRAVANACGANPVNIFVPCHRVVASHGRLGGYTGGVDIKLALLDVERPS